MAPPKLSTVSKRRTRSQKDLDSVEAKEVVKVAASKIKKSAPKKSTAKKSSKAKDFTVNQYLMNIEDSNSDQSPKKSPLKKEPAPPRKGSYIQTGYNYAPLEKMYELSQLDVTRDLFPVRDTLESVCRQLEDVGNKALLNRKLFDARDSVREWFANPSLPAYYSFREGD